jgi:hypothetical protein
MDEWITGWAHVFVCIISLPICNNTSYSIIACYIVKIKNPDIELAACLQDQQLAVLHNTKQWNGTTGSHNYREHPPTSSPPACLLPTCLLPACLPASCLPACLSACLLPAYLSTCLPPACLLLCLPAPGPFTVPACVLAEKTTHSGVIKGRTGGRQHASVSLPVCVCLFVPPSFCLMSAFVPACGLVQVGFISTYIWMRWGKNKSQF